MSGMEIPINKRAHAEKVIDTELMIDMAMKGFTQGEMASELGISVPTLARRITRIQGEQHILLQYRSLQSLQLTSLQARLLEAITPDKIAAADLKDLVLCFKILKEKELVMEGKPTEIKGLLGYLVQLEKEEAALQAPIDIGELRAANDFGAIAGECSIPEVDFTDEDDE